MLSWGNAKGPAAPSGAKGVLCLTSSPQVSMAYFPSQVPLSHFCQCISSWPATPVLHYSAENNTHTETGKLYFICQPCSAPEKPLELIHYAAFDSLLLRGWVKVLGALQEGSRPLDQRLSAPSCAWSNQQSLFCSCDVLVSLWALHWQWCNQSHLVWSWGTHNGLSALAFVIHFVSRTCL